MKAAAVAILLTALGPSTFSQTISLDDVRVGSSAQLWFQRSPSEKEVFLEGLCEGFMAGPTSNLHLMYCADDLPKDPNDKGWNKRFCGLVSIEPRKAVEYLDAFFKQRKYSDVANWAAIAAYNDKACGEQAVTPSLPRMQAKNECHRALANMSRSVATEARKKQREHCASLPAR